MRNIYQEKRIDRLKRQGIELEARTVIPHLILLFSVLDGDRPF